MGSILTPEAWQDLLGVSDEMNKRLDSMEKKAAEQKAAVESVLKDTVAELVKYACIDEVQQDQAYEALRDHVSALNFIKKLAAKQVDTNQLGSAVPAGGTTVTKQANHLKSFAADPLQSEAAVALLEKSRTWRQ